MKKEGDKMHCPKCGALNENDAIFCKHCGLPLEENSFKEKINQESMNDNKSKKQEVNRTTGKTKKPKNKNKTKHKTKNNNKTKIKKSKPQKISNETPMNLEEAMILSEELEITKEEFSEFFLNEKLQNTTN